MEAKNKLIRLFFGGKPDRDLPWLWKLKDEIEEAIEVALDQDEFKKYANIFPERSNPKFSRFAYVMAHLENEVLSKIVEEVEHHTGSKAICLIYDGAIIESRDAENYAAIDGIVKQLEVELNLKINVTKL